MALKHIGRLKSNQRKIVVAFRTVPSEPHNAIVVTTENLEAADHDTLMKAVESNAGQNADEFAEVMARTQLSDGMNMLEAFDKRGKMIKIETSNVEMTPHHMTVVRLDELNKLIAEQKGVTVADLAVKPSAESVPQEETVEEVVAPEVANEEVLTDEKLAAQYRSQADSLFKEAKRLREQAEELVPTKKKAKTAESV